MYYRIRLQQRRPTDAQGEGDGKSLPDVIFEPVATIFHHPLGYPDRRRGTESNLQLRLGAYLQLH